MYDKFNEEVKNYGKWFYGALGILFIVIIVVTCMYNKSNEMNMLNHITTVFTTQNNESNESKDSAETINKTKVELAHNESKVDNNQAYNSKEVSVSNRIMEVLDSLIYRLPFVLPAFWLVVFVSRRRNEAQRLAQEYAHKEALAKSYDSYKQQIEKLSEENRNELLPKLMDNMLKAISLNPAETLDKNHKDPTPIEEVIKKKEFWDFIEKVKSLVPAKKE